MAEKRNDQIKEYFANDNEWNRYYDSSTVNAVYRDSRLVHIDHQHEEPYQQEKEPC